MERSSLPPVLTCILVLIALSACKEEQGASADQVIRGLRAYKISAYTENRVRRFPSLLQPADVSQLSFEIAGQLKAVNLDVGQRVHLGDLLMEIDPRSLQSQVEQARANVDQAQAQLSNAEGDFARKEELLKKGYASQAVFDQSKATFLTAKARVEQAQRQLDLATQNLDRSKLLAPFAGTIAGVDVKSFGQVAPGQVVFLFGCAVHPIACPIISAKPGRKRTVQIVPNDVR